MEVDVGVGVGDGVEIDSGVGVGDGVGVRLGMGDGVDGLLGVGPQAKAMTSKARVAIWTNMLFMPTFHQICAVVSRHTDGAGDEVDYVEIRRTSAVPSWIARVPSILGA